jgi:hypothetical protein
MFITALLHDVVEDCSVPLEEIEKRYGEQVAVAVDCLSRRIGETYKDYILRCKGNTLARRVKLADIEDNLLPERIGSLDPKEAESLRKRYTKAKVILGAGIEED